MKATINYNAKNTWLEPYIQWEVNIVRRTKKTVWFTSDQFDGVQESDADNFTIKETNP